MRAVSDAVAIHTRRIHLDHNLVDLAELARAVHRKRIFQHVTAWELAEPGLRKAQLEWGRNML
jgi:hypothetical protein